MKATARRVGTYRHEIAIRNHGLSADEPTEHGGQDAAPSPQEALLMEIRDLLKALTPERPTLH